jgi:hypothetical protein
MSALVTTYKKSLYLRHRCFTYIRIVQFKGHHPHQTSKKTPPPWWIRLQCPVAWLKRISLCPRNNLFRIHWSRVLSKVFVQQCKLAENIIFFVFILVFTLYPISITLNRSTGAPLAPPPVAHHIPSLPRRARMFLVGCCVFICRLAAT